jgi:hypothetical protein
MSFFGIDSPGALFAKALRERERMAEQMHIDHVYNFFVTVGQLPDYMRRRSEVPHARVDALCKHPAIMLARDLCDTAKHVELTKPGRTTPNADIYENSIFRSGFGASNFGSQTHNWMVRSSGGFVGISVVADEAIALWTQFFEEHGISRAD